MCLSSPKQDLEDSFHILATALDLHSAQAIASQAHPEDSYLLSSKLLSRNTLKLQLPAFSETNPESGTSQT